MNSPHCGISEQELKSQHSEVTQDLKRKIRNLEQLLTDYKKSHGSIANFFNSIKDHLPKLPKEKVTYTAPKHTPTTIPKVSACILICDTHYGAVQNASEIEGFGQYSPEIAEQRCMKFVNNTINWVKSQRNAYDISNLHVLVCGDLCSGDIHQELQVTNAFPTPVQVIGSARLLASQLTTLAPHFSTITVEYITEDNHGRLTKKPQAKEAGLNSYNYLIGEFAKIMTSNQPNITFNIYPQLEVVVKVDTRNYLIMHGHGIRGWMGIPYYSVERKAAKEAMKRMNTQGKRFDKIIMGHFHHPISHPNYWIGGSTQGTDAYDHQCGRYAEPSQSAWLVGKHGEFNRVDFVL